MALFLVCGSLVLVVVGLGVLAWNNDWIPGAPPSTAAGDVRRVEGQVGAGSHCTYSGRDGDLKVFACDDKQSPDDLDFSACPSVVLYPDGRVDVGECYYSGGG